MKASGSFAPLGTLRNLLTIAHPEEGNHYGGQLQFGPEGDLFISTGDGGGGDDQHHNAQNLSSLLGKILRIDPDPGGLLPYTVPAGNPLPGPGRPPRSGPAGCATPSASPSTAAAAASGSATSARNTARRSTSRPRPASVAASTSAGTAARGGSKDRPTTKAAKARPADAFVEPIFDYPHVDPGDGGAHGCAIIGGYVSRDPGVGGLFGRYVYGDFCAGEIRSFAPTPAVRRATAPRASTSSNLTSFGEDSCGRLYAVSGGGAVYRIVGPAPTDCSSATGAARRSTPRSSASVPSPAGCVRNRRALITAWVSPCKGRQGDPVTLWRGRKQLGTRHLDRVCTARFRPRISRTLRVPGDRQSRTPPTSRRSRAS